MAAQVLIALQSINLLGFSGDAVDLGVPVPPVVDVSWSGSGGGIGDEMTIRLKHADDPAGPWVLTGGSATVGEAPSAGVLGITLPKRYVRAEIEVAGGVWLTEASVDLPAV